MRNRVETAGKVAVGETLGRPVMAQSGGGASLRSGQPADLNDVMSDLRQEARRTARARRQDKSWLDERLGITGLNKSYGRKAFPVHNSYFFGEIATFSFLILIITGILLAFLYIPSDSIVGYVPESGPDEIAPFGYQYPQAYASILAIEANTVMALMRNVHHWASHLFIFSILLHTMRIFFQGTYRKPRELNWIVGVVLLVLAIANAFFGYALPFDAYAIAATSIGVNLARATPFIGDWAAALVFGDSSYPAAGSLGRLYALHVFVLPLLLMGAIAAHLIILVKTKHSQPAYAKKVAEPGRVLGVPLFPQQAILGTALIFMCLGGLFLLSTFVPIHSVEAFGPPGSTLEEVKPEWYFMWIYGLLRILPSFDLFGIIDNNFVAGLLFPGIVFGALALAPFLDKTNRGRSLRRVEYAEPASQAPVRTTIGVFALTYLAILFVAAYYDHPFGLTIAQTWLITLGIPLILSIATYVFLKSREPKGMDRFDPHGYYDEEDMAEAEQEIRVARAAD
jgi:cytochrome b-561